MAKEKKGSGKSREQKPLRLLPGIIIGVLQLVIIFGVPIFMPGALAVTAFGGVGLAVLGLLWWVFFSRAARIERWGGLGLIIVLMLITIQFLHQSIAEAGMGFLFPIMSLPYVSLVLIAWAVITKGFPTITRRISFAVFMALACGFWITLQTGGFDADMNHDLFWRWEKSPEEQLLSMGDGITAAVKPTAIEAGTEADWPEFRGLLRDGTVRGSAIKTDWTDAPPKEVWRKPVGPGWSSFSVHENFIFTQEQRGEEEAVTCYNLQTGETVWIHLDTARFWESNGGAGPRGTPTLHGGCVYSLGGTGIMNVLNITDGTVVWSRDAAADTDTKLPFWGFSSSPLILDDAVIVAVSSSIISYDLATGEPRWFNSLEGDAHSSPHLREVDGVVQVVLQHTKGVSGYSPADGSLLWNYDWAGFPIVQPTLLTDGDILVSVDERNGIRRLSVFIEADEWKVEEVWQSLKLKPYFNDSAILDGYAYGYDGPMLACIDLKDGSRKWRGGRYGRGQFLLLADQNLLLVISEKGRLALVEAVPGQFTELANIPALTGKTWNHPVLVGDILLVRNAQEMVAFRLVLE